MSNFIYYIMLGVLLFTQSKLYASEEQVENLTIHTSAIKDLPLDGKKNSRPIIVESELTSIIEQYKRILPKIDLTINGENPEYRAKSIVLFLNQFKPPRIKPGGELEFIEKIKQLMAHGFPLHFILPSFPLKSKNTEKKVLGSDPDLGELIGLITLDHLCQQISQVYPSGAKVTLVSDGVYCAEALSASEEEATDYIDKIRMLIAALKFTESIRILSLSDFEGTPTYQKSFEEIRMILNSFDLKQMGISYDPKILEDFSKNEIKECVYYEQLIKARALLQTKNQRKFVKELSLDLKKAMECLNFDQTLSFIQQQIKIEEEAILKKTLNSISMSLESNYKGALKLFPSEIAQVISQRTRQFNCYLSSIINEDQIIRLSNYLHHPDMSKKLPFCLIYGDPEPGTPWHHTPVVRKMGKTDIKILMRGRDFLSKPQKEFIEGVSFPICWVQYSS